MFYRIFFFIFILTNITFAGNLVTSDDFSSPLNSSVWTQTKNTNESINVSNGELVMTLAGGTNNDAFVGGNNSVRIMQNIGQNDFFVETKIDSISNSKFIGAGIMIIQDINHYI